jgi:tRNA (mo5U34)-methyltransferase
LAEDFAGQTVLDLGARDGFFSFEVERRGASRVVALDYVSSDLTGFDLCKTLLESQVEWITANVYQINQLERESFDAVLFLGLIYHLRHPILALDRIHDVLKVGGRLYLETHIIDDGFVLNDGRWGKLADFGQQIADTPLAQFYFGGALGNDPTSPWAPNLACLVGLVESAGFVVQRSWKNAFRGGLTARKIPLPENHPRYIDIAQSFDMHGKWEIQKSGDV